MPNYGLEPKPAKLEHKEEIETNQTQNNNSTPQVSFDTETINPKVLANDFIESTQSELDPEIRVADEFGLAETVHEEPEGEIISALEAESIKELTTQLELEIRTELTNQLKPEITASLEAELEQELSKKLEPEIRAILESEIETELEKRLEPEVRASLEENIEKDLIEKLEPEIRVSLESEIEAELEKLLEPEVRASLEVGLEKELTAKLEPEIRTRLESIITIELENKLKQEAKVSLETELDKELKEKFQLEIRESLEKELRATIESEYKEKNQFFFEAEEVLESANPGKINLKTKQIVEAILFASDKPMTTKQVQQVYPELEQPERLEIQTVINSIIEDYASRPVILKQLASGYRFQVKQGFSYWVARLFEEKPPKYSRALLETIAIIAYRQPVTRGDIEDIRGVGVSSNIIRTLLEREWVRVIAHKEVPGRPALYGTTKHFLDYFNLSSISQLPTLEEIKGIDLDSDNLDKPEIQKNEAQDQTEIQLDEEQAIEEKANQKLPLIEPESETRH